MPHTTTAQEQVAAAPEPSGIDLARLALERARKTAKNRPAGTPACGRRRTSTRHRSKDGRDPIGLAAAINGLVDDYAWADPATGGTILDTWNDIAPELVGYVTPVHYDAESGRLDLRPVSTAYATQLRVLQRQMITRINTKTGTAAVRALRILPPGPQPTTSRAPNGQTAAGTTAAADRTEAPLHTREDASAGYHRALAAHHQTARPRRTDPALAAAVQRQTNAMRALGEQAFPETRDAPGDELQAVRVQRRAEADATHAAALRRARGDRTGRLPETLATTAGYAPPLHRTA